VAVGTTVLAVLAFVVGALMVAATVLSAIMTLVVPRALPVTITRCLRTCRPSCWPSPRPVRPGVAGHADQLPARPRSPDAELCIRAGYVALRRIADFFDMAPDASWSSDRSMIEQNGAPHGDAPGRGRERRRAGLMGLAWVHHSGNGRARGWAWTH
jgi:hypothetical protein